MGRPHSPLSLKMKVFISSWEQTFTQRVYICIHCSFSIAIAVFNYQRLRTKPCQFLQVIQRQFVGRRGSPTQRIWVKYCLGVIIFIISTSTASKVYKTHDMETKKTTSNNSHPQNTKIIFHILGQGIHLQTVLAPPGYFC